MSYDEFFNKVNVLSSNKMYKFIDENLIECNDLISEINRVLLENGSVQILKNIRDIYQIKIIKGNNTSYYITKKDFLDEYCNDEKKYLFDLFFQSGNSITFNSTNGFISATLNNYYKDVLFRMKGFNLNSVLIDIYNRLNESKIGYQYKDTKIKSLDGFQRRII